jgi:aspartyl-tRNA(Asn)/glutamyl-tRNA(Gln) amidotransferase subunit A
MAAPSKCSAASLAFSTIDEAARLLRARKVSSLELVNAALERIERLNPSLNAFITVNADAARKQARIADREIRAGKIRGPLHGVPITIKDNFLTKGTRTTAGSKILADFIPDFDSHIVAQLHAAGAVSLGKTVLNEFAYGIHGRNPHYGDVHNPWDLRCTPGGSSSGSAASLAAGIGFASVGTDTGGSLRIPASFCGIVGFKPTFGLVSLAGVVPLAETLDHAGPLARTVEDAATVLSVIAGKYPMRVPALKFTQLRQNLPRRFRIGWPKNYFFDRVELEVQLAIECAVKALESLGGRTEAISLAHAAESVEASTAVGLVEALQYHSAQKYFPQRAADYSEDVRKRLELGLEVKALPYLDAARVRRELTSDFDSAFERVDVIVAPATACVAPPLGVAVVEIRGESVPLRGAVIDSNRPANFTGHPAISLPCGISTRGLPIGLQLIGPKWSEAKLLAIAHAYEQSQNWRDRRPAIGSELIPAS